MRIFKKVWYAIWTYTHKEKENFNMFDYILLALSALIIYLVFFSILGGFKCQK